VNARRSLDHHERQGAGQGPGQDAPHVAGVAVLMQIGTSRNQCNAQPRDSRVAGRFRAPRCDSRVAGLRGGARFRAPPRHYKMKISDENSERAAYIDIPLTFVSETPDVPEAGGKEKKK